MLLVLRLKKKVADQVENCHVLFFVHGKHVGLSSSFSDTEEIVP